MNIILSVIVVVSMELTIFAFVSLPRVGLDFFQPLNELFVLNLHKYLGDGRIEGW